MSGGVVEAGLVLGLISAIIAIINTTKQMYDTVKDKADLPKNFQDSAAHLPLILIRLEDAKTYIENTEDKARKDALTCLLEPCKDQAVQLQKLFKKVTPKEGASRLDRYVKVVQTIGKGGLVENLIKGIFEKLIRMATEFPGVTTPKGKEELATAIEEVSKMEPSFDYSALELCYECHGTRRVQKPHRGVLGIFGGEHSETRSECSDDDYDETESSVNSKSRRKKTSGYTSRHRK